jgi:hypothetical protein
MTVRELLTFFENYYGEKYTGLFLDTMTEYLENGTDEFLSAVRKIMVLRFSKIYNRSPCPADIEKHLGEIYEVMSSPKLYLPEPENQYATKEEAQEWLNEIKSVLSKGRGPLAGVMAEAIGGKHEN